MVPWNHLGARTLGGYLQTSLAKKGRPAQNVEAPSHGLWSWLNKRMYKKRNWVKHQHPLLSASWLKCLTPLLPCPPGMMDSIPSPKPWAETDHSLKLFLSHIFSQSLEKKPNSCRQREETAKADSKSKCCFYIHNNSPSVSVFKKNLKQTHKDWEYRSAVEHSKISFVPTSSCQEIYTENTCFSVKSRHNYLSILSKSIQHKKRAGSKGMGG